MKKVNCIIILSVLFLIDSFGQLRISSVSPSLYYTHGSYSNGNTSRSIAGYGTIGINYIDFISIGLEKLDIESTFWKYAQYNLSAGFTKNYYPFYFFSNYMYAYGKYSMNEVFYEYNDYINIYNVGITYNYDRFFFSGGLTYLDLNGYKSIVSRQYEFEILWFVSDYLSLSFLPAFNNISDNRSFYSVGSVITYSPFKNLIASLSGFVGERAYYFNRKLLTVFNQDDTQKNMYELKLQYHLLEKLNTSVSFQRTEFVSYQINYFTLGLKAYF
jgi:hypothetical protein